MKTWTPFLISLLVTFLLNFFPFFMAFIVRAEGWGEAGWAFYFFTIPLGALLLALGLIISLILFLRRRQKS